MGTEACPHWLSPLSLHFILPLGVEDIAAASLGALGSDIEKDTGVSFVVSTQQGRQ